jgi:O-antigen/teichoic acid export membrane protein
MVGSGVLAYLFQILAARALGPDAFGTIAVLWGTTFLVGIVLFRPLEQTVSRALADKLARGEEVGAVLRAAVRLYAALAIPAFVAAVLAWEPLTNRLFGGDSTMTALLVAGVLGYGVAYLARGLSGGMRWFSGYGASLMADGTTRLVVALPLLFVASIHLAGLAMAVAGIAGALPLVLGRRRIRALPRRKGSRGFDFAAAAKFAWPASLMAGSDQLLVNGAPLLVMIDGGARAKSAAGVVFAATMLVRVPVYVFQGLAASLLPNLTRMHAQEDAQAVRRVVVRTSAILLAVGAAVVAGCALFGPEALRVLYGSGFTGGRGALALLGAGVGCYLAAMTVTQGLLAADRGAQAAVPWTIAAGVFVVLYASLPGGQLMRVSGSFLGGTLVVLVGLLAVAVGRRGVRARSQPEL